MDQELAHDGGEGDEVMLAVGFEALVKGAQDGIAPGGGEGGHEEAMANLPAPTADGTGAAKSPAVAIERGQPGQGGDGLTAEGAELRQVG